MPVALFSGTRPKWKSSKIAITFTCSAMAGSLRIYAAANLARSGSSSPLFRRLAEGAPGHCGKRRENCEGGVPAYPQVPSGCAAIHIAGTGHCRDRLAHTAGEELFL